jgi:glyoxylase-like metal-dependent hydrolase (beta-lactamase superfamily II)
MSLEQIAGAAHYLPGRVNIGVLIGETEAAFIDTGLDEGQARKAVQAVEQLDLGVTAIVNTHAHADHCGGNSFVRRRTGAVTYAPHTEAALIAHTELEPFSLFGAAPFPAIDSKWLHATPTAVEHILDDSLRLCGMDLEVIPVPGHSINQIAVATPEVAFLGDALVAPEILARYPIQYCYDVCAHRQTLARLASLQKAWYVGAHFNPTPDLETLLAANRRNIDRTADAVLDALASPAGTETVVAAVATALGASAMDPAAYFLNSAAIKAHLSAHVRENRITLEIRDHRPLWRRLP